jgi:uncharacterized membrane protein HdeD (DUF308 family)
MKKDLLATLLSNISLSTALANLALVMLIAILLLLSAVTGNSSTNRSQSTLGTVLDSLTPVLQLALSFLLLASSVLLRAAATESFVADQVAYGFFGRAEGLVPLA